MDLLIALFVFTPLLFVPVVIVLPALVYLLTRSFLWAAATYFAISCIWTVFTVWSVRLSEIGIHFIRLFGRPRLLRWEEITDIAEAPRREVVIQGWLNPRFPAREMTACLSALHHFRIRWRDDWCYYPPHDTENFRRLIDRFNDKHAP